LYFLALAQIDALVNTTTSQLLKDFRAQQAAAKIIVDNFEKTLIEQEKQDVKLQDEV
jgi:hypothetical protein